MNSLRNIAIILALFPITCISKNIGVYGSVYTIAEPNTIEWIHKKLVNMQKTGELQSRFKQYISKSVTRPERVIGVTSLGNKKPKIWTFDPTIIVNRNIYSSDGALVIKAGAKVNPLSKIDFDETLIFFDGDNQKEMEWVSKYLNGKELNKRNVRLILTGGDVRDTSQYLHEKTYFDQLGNLCNRFGIKHTPTIVNQAINSESGLKIPQLLIREVAVD